MCVFRDFLDFRGLEKVGRKNEKNLKSSRNNIWGEKSYLKLPNTCRGVSMGKYTTYEHRKNEEFRNIHICVFCPVGRFSRSPKCLAKKWEKSMGALSPTALQVKWPVSRSSGLARLACSPAGNFPFHSAPRIRHVAGVPGDWHPKRDFVSKDLPILI